ncbi:HI0074 family nucleotidyltransferase substrate-binding subunit [Thermaurantimonas aggregans]|uniref:HI0074 family nucleotidyltransferase substrate-binding subunit n=1 Tax=Thermaurantimonas aggregans TaxID=2173829 RepID=UPI000F57273B
MAWKLLKDYLEEQGFSEVNSPRSTVKKAFEVGLIEEGHLWLERLHNQNFIVHTYDKYKSSEMLDRIAEKYFPVFKRLKSTFEGKLDQT